jgi:hypothetical protein
MNKDQNKLNNLEDDCLVDDCLDCLDMQDIQDIPDMQDIQDIPDIPDIPDIQLSNLTNASRAYTPPPNVFNKINKLVSSSKTSTIQPSMQEAYFITLNQELDKLNEKNKTLTQGLEATINKINKKTTYPGNTSTKVNVYDTPEMLTSRKDYYNCQLAKICERIKNKQREIDIFPERKPRVRTDEQMCKINKDRQKARATQCPIKKEKNRQKAKVYRAKCKVKQTHIGLRTTQTEPHSVKYKKSGGITKKKKSSRKKTKLKNKKTKKNIKSKGTKTKNI